MTDLVLNLNILVGEISNLHKSFKDQALRQINTTLTIRNWIIGYLIAEYELKGSDRAKYGQDLYKKLAIRLKNLKELNDRYLYGCKLFYLAYPEISRTLSAKFQHIDFIQKNILQTLSAKCFSEIATKIRPSYALKIEVLINRLSFSHFIELTRLEPEPKKIFYEVESIKNNWSVRDLKRTINSMLYERTGLSSNKEDLLKKETTNQKLVPEDIIKNPYILEFLGLEEKPEYSEEDLEQAIINHLQTFLLEAGRGFCFESRQKRISFDNTHYRIDLVFYHRILKCYILIDLKLGEFTHADVGQMNLYLNYFKEEEKSEGDNDPIGIILCAGKNETLVKYATGNLSEQIFVSRYLMSLPNEEELKKIIDSERRGM